MNNGICCTVKTEISLDTYFMQCVASCCNWKAWGGLTGIFVKLLHVPYNSLQSEEDSLMRIFVFI